MVGTATTQVLEGVVEGAGRETGFGALLAWRDREGSGSGQNL